MHTSFILSLVKCPWLVSKRFKVHIWASCFSWFHGFNIVYAFTLPKLMSSYVHIYSIYSALIVYSWVSVRCTSLNISTKCLIPTFCPTPQYLLCSTPSSLEHTNHHPSSFSVWRPSDHFILFSHLGKCWAWALRDENCTSFRILEVGFKKKKKKRRKQRAQCCKKRNPFFMSWRSFVTTFTPWSYLLTEIYPQPSGSLFLWWPCSVPLHS